MLKETDVHLSANRDTQKRLQSEGKGSSGGSLGGRAGPAASLQEELGFTASKPPTLLPPQQGPERSRVPEQEASTQPNTVPDSLLFKLAVCFHGHLCFRLIAELTQH